MCIGGGCGKKKSAKSTSKPKNSYAPSATTRGNPFGSPKVKVTFGAKKK